MELYVKVAFWLNLLAVVLCLLDLATKEYPYRRDITIGEKVALALTSAGFAIWAGMILWVAR